MLQEYRDETVILIGVTEPSSSKLILIAQQRTKSKTREND
jgi:hypothetical protein